MEQVQIIGAHIMSLAGYITKSPGDAVETSIHFQTTVPTGTHTFWFWSIFGKMDTPEPGSFAFMSGAMNGGFVDLGTEDNWVTIPLILGEFGEVYAGDWDCLLIICEDANWMTGYIYDLKVVPNALTITGAAELSATILEAGFS